MTGVQRSEKNLQDGLELLPYDEITVQISIMIRLGMQALSPKFAAKIGHLLLNCSIISFGDGTISANIGRGKSRSWIGGTSTGGRLIRPSGYLWPSPSPSDS
jgi:hypothetical protein